MTTSRRHFIKTIVLASGAVFTGPGRMLAATAPRTRTLDHRRAHAWLRAAQRDEPAQTEDTAVDVVVVGAGPAGLAAAWMLRRRGVAVRVLDTEAEAGGTLRAASWNGIPYPLGSTFFVRYSGTYREFYESIGATPLETGEDALWFEGRDPVVDWWSPSVIGTLPLPSRDVDAFRKFRDIVQAMDTIPRYPLRDARLSDLERYDRISAREFLAGFGSARLARTMDLYCRSVLGAPMAEVNAYSLLNFYAFEFGDSFRLPCFTFPDGLATVAARAAASLGDVVQTGALVTSVVQNGAAGVDVTYRTMDGVAHRIRCKAAVVAVQKRIAAEIVRALPPARVDAMRAVRYAPYVTVALCANQPLAPARAFDFWFDDAYDRFTDVIDCTSPVDAVRPRRSSGYVYMLSSQRPAAERTRLQDDAYQAQLAQDLIDALDAHVPGVRDRVEEAHIFTWGHSLVVPSVGSHTSLHPLIAPPFGDIHFANADNDLAPSIENALGAGFDAADAIIARL